MYNQIFFHKPASIFHLAFLVQNIQLAESLRWKERLMPCADFSRYLQNDHDLCV